MSLYNSYSFTLSEDNTAVNQPPPYAIAGNTTSPYPRMNPAVYPTMNSAYPAVNTAYPTVNAAYPTGSYPLSYHPAPNPYGLSGPDPPGIGGSTA